MLVTQYPDRVQVEEIGKSFEKRPIKMITITNPVTRQIKRNQSPIIFIEGGIRS